MLLKNEDYEKLLAKALGISVVGIHRKSVVDTEMNKIGIAIVKEVWWGNIDNFWDMGSVTFAIVNYSYHLTQKNLMAGVLFVPIYDSAWSVVAHAPLRHVWLANWNDPVKVALQSINLLETESEVIPGAEVTPRISLTIHVPNGTRTLKYDGGPIVDATWLKLFDACMATIDMLRREYADPDIEEYFSRGPKFYTD